MGGTQADAATTALCSRNTRPSSARGGEFAFTRGRFMKHGLSGGLSLSGKVDKEEVPLYIHIYKGAIY